MRQKITILLGLVLLTSATFGAIDFRPKKTSIKQLNTSMFSTDGYLLDGPDTLLFKTPNGERLKGVLIMKADSTILFNGNVYRVNIRPDVYIDVDMFNFVSFHNDTLLAKYYINSQLRKTLGTDTKFIETALDINDFENVKIYPPRKKRMIVSVIYLGCITGGIVLIVKGVYSLVK